MKKIIVLSVIVTLCLESQAQGFDTLNFVKTVEDTVAFWQEVKVTEFGETGKTVQYGDELDTAAYLSVLTQHAEFIAEEQKQIYLLSRQEAKLRRQFNDVDGLIKDLTGDKFVKIKTDENIHIIKASKWSLKWPDGTAKLFEATGNNGRVKSTEDADYFRVQYKSPGQLIIATGIFATKARTFISVKGEFVNSRGVTVERFGDVDGLGFVLTRRIPKQ